MSVLLWEESKGKGLPVPDGMGDKRVVFNTGESAACISLAGESSSAGEATKGLESSGLC